MQLVIEVLVHFIESLDKPDLTGVAHKERTDALSMTSIANEFVSRNPSRMKIFGKF